jgi:hypothetical protein
MSNRDRARAAGRVGAPRRRRTLDRAGLALLGAALLMAVLSMPFAIASMAGSLRHPVAADAFHIVVPATRAGATTALNVRLVAIDETVPKVTLGVTGDRRCISNCGAGQVIEFFSLHADPRGSDGAPPSQNVDVPPDGEFDTSVDLPVTGGLGSYPFDRYHLLLGFALANKTADGQLVTVPAAAARRQLDVSVDEQLSRLDLATPKDVTSNYRFVGADVALAAQLDLSRPLYLQALTVLIIVFIAIAGIYSVITREFKEVIGTVGVVVLGVWGVRTLLVGSYPPDSTAVDLILVLLILMLLVILMVRGLMIMWQRTDARPIAVDSPHQIDASSSATSAAERVQEHDPFEVFSEIA